MLSFLHNHLDKNAYELWNVAFKERNWPKKDYHFQPRNTINVLLTMTTCKRVDLFEQTIQSILHTWKDIDQVDSWFCVDDNSSEEDRAKMKEYSWIEYHMKGPSEKGHRKSMNLIWNKLQEVKPTYWIHIEDDFVFHVERSYVTDAIRGLELLNVEQLIYNRNYGETMNDYTLNGHIPVTEDFCLHEYKSGSFPYQNCHYWPHYSFRPGLTKVDAILKLGNFDSSNTFFEMDYANRWTNAGYKTGFFNDITCQHIGKLTKDKSSSNAYALNDCNQFITPIRVVNLERRPDRKKNVEEQLKGIPYEFFKAVDGSTLQMTKEITTLFFGNDFDNRKGVMGCALSHYQLWKQLVNDSIDYYLILEDDITVPNDFQSKLASIESTIKTMDVCFLGYHMYKKDRDALTVSELSFQSLQKNKYVGGTFAYSINKEGAKKLIQYIEKYGIKHGIDYVMKISPIDSMECNPQLLFSEWNEHYIIDSDIQGKYDSLSLSNDYIFLKGLDSMNYDITRDSSPIADVLNKYKKDSNIAGINTLGYVKSKVNVNDLKSTIYFNFADGIYIKKQYYDLHKQIRVKMLCNWCSSEELCNQWSTMAEENFTWKQIKMVWEGDCDYYVVINSTTEHYDPSKTFVFQMEPWVYTSDPWGVKTWGDWINPNCLHFRGRKTSHVNTIQWQLEQTYTEWLTLPIVKYKFLSTICSSKYQDEGHKLRVDTLKYFESKGLPIDIYGVDNGQQFTNYTGPLDKKEKSKGILPYKYYFMMENNFENNYITEKLWEPILCESLCFYYGCPNVSDHIDPRAYVLLDKDPEISYQIVKKAIEEDWYSQRLPYIKAAKKDILHRMYFFPTLYTEIQKSRKEKIIFDYKRICVIHSDCSSNLIEKVRDKVDHIFLFHHEPLVVDDPKVTVYVSNMYDSMETYHFIRTCAEYNDCEILYLKTKNTNNSMMRDLQNMILYFLVDKIEDCMNALKENDTVGCNLNETYIDNMCWSKSSYLKTLPYSDENWLYTNHKAKHFCIHDSKLNHNEYVYPAFLYQK
jgi:GR25 family glycosyltransferase involved in LPS biosynthesis